MIKYFLFILISWFSLAQAAMVDGTIRLTFKADPKADWQALQLASKKISINPKFDNPPSWDLRFKQGYVGTNNATAAVVALAKNTKYEKFEDIEQVPDGLVTYNDQEYDPTGPAEKDIYNPLLVGKDKIKGWFYYKMDLVYPGGANLPYMVHLCQPKPLVYIIQTADHHYVKLKFEDYIYRGYAMRLVNDEWRVTAVGKDDDQITLEFRYRYNTVAWDKSFK